MRAAYTHILVLAFHPFCSALKNLYDLWGLSLLTAVNPWLQWPSPTLCTTGNPALDATRVIVM